MPFLSKRWETIFYLASGVVVNYCLRVNISVAVQDMKDDLNWTEYEKGLILSSFYWGYALGQIPITLIASKVGAKYTFGFAILGSAFVTLFVPIAAKTSFGLALLTRALVGLASSATFPSCYHFFPKWIPIAEKTIMVAVVGAGLYMGEIIGFGVSGYLVGSSSDIRIGDMQFGGWPLAFYVFAFLGFAWFPFFAFNVYASPEEDPSITPEEILLIKKGKDDVNYVDSKVKNLLPKNNENDDQWEHNRLIQPKITDDPLADIRKISSTSSRSVSVADAVLPREIVSHEHTQDAHTTHDDFSTIPWKTIFTHPASLTLLMMSFTYNWTLFMLLSEIPSFLTDSLGFDLEESGLLSVVPYFTNFCSVLLFAQVFENLQLNHGWSVRKVRQVAMQFCILGSGFSLVICGFVDNRYGAFAFMVLSLFFFGAGASGINCAFLDISPRYSSTINTIGNTVGAVSGLLAPIIVSALVTSIEGKWGWRFVFMLTAAMGVVSIIIWAIFQTSDVVPVLNTPVPLSHKYQPTLNDANDDEEEVILRGTRPSNHHKL